MLAILEVLDMFVGKRVKLTLGSIFFQLLFLEGEQPRCKVKDIVFVLFVDIKVEYVVN